MSQHTSDPATLRLPFKEKLAYGMGDLGSNILLDIGTLYLLKFYTDVLGLPGTYGGIIFLIAKFFTAFTDMGTGIMLDSRRKIGPKGKFRPFVLYAAFPVTLLAIANFVGTPFEITGKTVMATVLFMLYGLFFSMMNCSYGAMVPAITKNPDERASLAAWRQGGATLGLLLCTVGFFSMGCIFIGVFMMPGAVRRFGKKKVYISGLMIWVAGDLLNYFFGGGSVSFVAFSCLAFFGSAFVNSLNWALVSDIVEYGEWRTGVRSEGTVYTGFTFFRKVSQALAGFFPGIMLTQIGYVPNVVQSAGTVEGLRQLIFIYPSLLAVITIVAMGCFYNLNEKMYVRIVEEIELRKRTA